ncbi:hypothetical protein AKJ62_03700 [candidate division MSBL1 archaeon SCGC-AAA259D14]|uniref:Uncharacterized protein n=1 Tax=candidate division MSBL1 archaeon SCGC-AAA259D14 TaxID=1698261 RepID=A0A133U4N2_9EURY|nr:hypothetical protein AKJ62_03700 [candidate division MSBL1 archaeon SCGC-AAA259D14]
MASFHRKKERHIINPIKQRFTRFRSLFLRSFINKLAVLALPEDPYPRPRSTLGFSTSIEIKFGKIPVVALKKGVLAIEKRGVKAEKPV